MVYPAAAALPQRPMPQPPERTNAQKIRDIALAVLASLVSFLILPFPLACMTSALFFILACRNLQTPRWCMPSLSVFRNPPPAVHYAFQPVTRIVHAAPAPNPTHHAVGSGHAYPLSRSAPPPLKPLPWAEPPSHMQISPLPTPPIRPPRSLGRSMPVGSGHVQPGGGHMPNSPWPLPHQVPPPLMRPPPAPVQNVPVGGGHW